MKVCFDSARAYNCLGFQEKHTQTFSLNSLKFVHIRPGSLGCYQNMCNRRSIVPGLISLNDHCQWLHFKNILITYNNLIAWNPINRCDINSQALGIMHKEPFNIMFMLALGKKIFSFSSLFFVHEMDHACICFGYPTLYIHI